MKCDENERAGNDAEQEQRNTKQEEKPRLDISRRTFALGVCGAAVLFGLGGLKLVGTKSVIRPPGGQDEDLLIGACTRCVKCIEACPKRVITAVHAEEGFLVMRTPTLDFTNNFCDWCAEEAAGMPLCVKSCPTQALRLPDEATSENTIIGKAKIAEDWCLAYRLIGCRDCYDACPYDAIELNTYDLSYVITEKCNGCGACENVCVSLKNASISNGATSKAVVVHPVS